ncbi:unnamed protein product [Trichobilharzia szidati]|nr:unnamed protein product [Trichobilharzia szidati]
MVKVVCRDLQMEKQPSLEVFSVVELEDLLLRQMNLHKSLFSKLPDSGEKLQKSIQKIQSVLTEKKNFAPLKTTEELTPSNIQGGITRKLSNSVSKIEENNSTNDIDENVAVDSVDVLSNDLAKISVSLSSCDVTDSYSDNTYDSVPCMSFEEYAVIRKSLNLPCSYMLNTFRWFTFAIRFVGDLVYLSVVDCRSPNRNLLRVGLFKTWFPGMDSPNTKSKPIDNVKMKKMTLYQPTQALHDLWLFLTTKPSQHGTVSSSLNNEVCCLICYPFDNNANTPNDILYLSRLIRSTRHSSIVRSIQPYDCYFTNAQCALMSIVSCSDNRNATDEIVNFINDMKKRNYDYECLTDTTTTNNNNTSSNATNDGKVTIDAGQHLMDECCKLCEFLFTQVTSGDNVSSTDGDIQLRHFRNPMEYLKLSKVKTMMWMEAPMELYLLRKLKTACSIMTKKSTSTTENNVSNNLNKVPDEILRRLALVGLGRTRLTRLAGLGGWKGFAGFLAYRSLSSTSQDTSTTDNDDDAKGKAFVTDDLQVIHSLYSYFRNIYMHLDRHEKCYLEDNKSNYKQERSLFKQAIPSRKIYNPLLLSNIDYFNDVKIHLTGNNNMINNQENNNNKQSVVWSEKLQAWTASGNQLFDPHGQRQLCRLSMQQSMDLMKKVQLNYENSRIKYKLPSYPTMPPEPTKLNRYRDPSVMLIKEVEDSSSSSSSSSSTSSDAESSDSDNESLHLEDVD